MKHEQAEIREEIYRLDNQYGHTAFFFNTIFTNWTDLDKKHYKEICKRYVEVNEAIWELLPDETTRTEFHRR